MNELIPIVAQDYQTGDVRMVGVWNEESVAVSDETGNLTFWSRTKWRLWTKGETSGDLLEIQKGENIICPSANDTVQASIVYQVRQIIWETGMTCHRGTPTCFWDDEFGIQNRLVLNRLDYAKMNGKVLVLTQALPSNKILWVRMLDEANVNYLVQNFSEKSEWNARMCIDCDNDTLLIRVPMEIASFKS